MPNKTSSADVWNWAKHQLAIIPMMLTVFSAVGGLIWVVYAEPAVKQVVEDSTKPTKIKVERLENKMEHIQFENKQQLYLLKKIAGKNAVKDMEEETEIFKPEDYEGEQ